jgi:hypothetical protein
MMKKESAVTNGSIEPRRAVGARRVRLDRSGVDDEQDGGRHACRGPGMRARRSTAGRGDGLR